jgi:2,4-dienoyl-CoA reductase-like NADH-dependent reductase (Old Yellow Enzyme family)
MDMEDRGNMGGTGRTQLLFHPFRLKSLRLKNRFVMAPMTRQFSPGGIPTAEVAAYYRRRAQGQVGLILSEGTFIDRPATLSHPDIPRFYGDEALAGWKRVVDSVHAASGIMGPQLWHVGIDSPDPSSDPSAEGADGAPPVCEGPSGLYKPGERSGRAMSEEDIIDTIAAYSSAAQDAKRLGFDMIEIHGAHGYLIDQFLWKETNHRSDAYGGATVGERTRFAVEVVQNIRQAVGDDFVICLRLSQWKLQDYAAKLAQTPQEMEGLLVPLAEAGVDLFHCSQRRFFEPEFEGSDLNFAGWAKKVTGKPTITVGSVGLSGEFLQAFAGEVSTHSPLDELLRRYERGDFDLVAVGRALLADPAWVRKIRDGRLSELGGFEREALSTLI